MHQRRGHVSAHVHMPELVRVRDVTPSPAANRQGLGTASPDRIENALVGYDAGADVVLDGLLEHREGLRVPVGVHEREGQVEAGADDGPMPIAVGAAI